MGENIGDAVEKLVVGNDFNKKIILKNTV